MRAGQPVAISSNSPSIRMRRYLPPLRSRWVNRGQWRESEDTPEPEIITRDLFSGEHITNLKGSDSWRG